MITREEAERAIEDLRKIFGSSATLDFVGAFARGASASKDIDIFVDVHDEDAFTLRAILLFGTRHPGPESSFNGNRVEFYFGKNPDLARWIWTANKGHRIAMARAAKKRGLRLNQDGVWDGDSLVAATPDAVASLLDLDRFGGASFVLRP